MLHFYSYTENLRDMSDVTEEMVDNMIKKLDEMQSLIDICPDGTLSILSRRGLYKYGKGMGVFKRSLDYELEGTLIEWELTLPGRRT